MNNETETRESRTIGTVTTATGGGAAIAYLICALVQMIFPNVEISTEFQGALTVVLVLLSGWIVPPTKSGRHA